jgi:hypothetical protein
MGTLKLPKRPFLTHQQLDWANSIGITAERAYWLASCPSDTKIGNKNRPKTIHHLFDQAKSFLYKQPGGNFYYFRLKRANVNVMRKLSTDIKEARTMRDAIINEMNLTLKK